MDPAKFFDSSKSNLVLAHPGSGTRSLHSWFCEHGFEDVMHEGHKRPYQTNVSYLDWRLGDYDVVTHLVRNPLLNAFSIAGLMAFDPQVATLLCATARCPDRLRRLRLSFDGDLARAMYCIVDFHDRAEPQADRTIRIEDLEFPPPRVPLRAPSHRAQFPRFRVATWERAFAADEESAHRLLDASRRYGYLDDPRLPT